MPRARGKVTLFPHGEAALIPRLVLPASRVPRTPRPWVRTDHEHDTMRTDFATAAQADTPAKPRGGYRIITAAILTAAWGAYRLKLIRLVDLRVWYATHEMDARRCRVEQGHPRRFHREELRKLTGLSLKRLKDSLRRLEAARILSWSETTLGFPDAPDVLALERYAGLQAFLDKIPNPDRKIPVPRRTLRLLAGGARPALIATVLGHLIRGLYLKSGKCLDRGRVKASWIVDTFGVSLRRVKQARHELIAGGWLIPLDADQWALNRWGAHFRINLEWSRLDEIKSVPSVASTSTDLNHPILGEASPGSGPELAPPQVPTGPELAPPESYEKPLHGRGKNQKPASGPAGISIFNSPENAPRSRTSPHAVSESVPPALLIPPAQAHVARMTIPPGPAPVAAGSGSPAPSRSRPASAGQPNLRDVVLEDLKDTGRLLDLYDQGIARGWVTASERDRLRFVSAAEHARVIGTKNPCGLFVRLVRCGLWSFLTQDDEDAANARLKLLLYGKPLGPKEPPPASPTVREVETISEDARLVQAIRASLARVRYRGDAFPFLKRERPEWTRERWDRALEELPGQSP